MSRVQPPFFLTESQMKTSSDLTALILSFQHMWGQLRVSSVCKEWKKLVERHRLLLRMIDFGDPQRFPSALIDSILTTAGSRIRSFRICTFHFTEQPISIPDKKFRSPNLDTLLPKVVQFLQHLILVGHLPLHGASFPNNSITLPKLVTLLSTSSSPKLKVTVETCPCALNLVEKEIQLANQHDFGPRLSLESECCVLYPDAALFVCPNCRISVRWARRCSDPMCRKEPICCSECSYKWQWAPEIKVCCDCPLCQERRKFVLSQKLVPPLWTCSIHCPKHY